VTDIIDQIDAAAGCQQCGKPLDVSPSTDFCSEGCQRAWTACAHQAAQLPVGWSFPSVQAPSPSGLDVLLRRSQEREPW
jgi:hypothetical protein